MKIIFVRHGDPNYELDTLTEKGWREAELLADRLEKLEVKEFYSSPLGRAKATAECTTKRFNRDYIVKDWMQEFFYLVDDPDTGAKRIPWDFMPNYWTNETMLYDKDKWYRASVMQTGEIESQYSRVKTGLDQLLSEHGYVREGNYYKAEKANTDTIIIFCHLGAEFVMLSHLLGIAAPVLWQNFFVSPTSVTMLCTEERVKGEASFRCQMLGDTSHLYIGNEPRSLSGFFNEV